MKSVLRSKRLLALTFLTLVSLVVPAQLAFAGVSLPQDAADLQSPGAAPLAATYTVTTTADSGAGSLRAAIEAANANPGPDEITFSLAYPATITLASALPSISGNLTITGPGAASLTISGGGVARIFYVQTGVTVSISGLTLTGGNADRGGAIYNFGALTITNSVLTSNTATQVGGAIANTGAGTLTITGSTLSNNVAPTGGAIHHFGSNITISASTIDNNQATDSTGGAIMSTMPITITTSTLSNNQAQTGGGGILNFGSTLTITASLFYANEALYGGGISSSGTLTVANTTFSGNTVSNNGGGIYNSGTATITNVTFTGGYAGASGGLFNKGTATVTNSIFDDIDSLENCQGPIINGGGNWSDDGWCVFEPERMYVDVRVNPSLANNGGPTLTHALLTGSPALGTGNAAACAAAPVNNVDQRGFARPNPVGEDCDSGAFESSFPKPAAQNYVVNSLADPGDGTCDVANCTLREAITAANTNAGITDTITFSVTGTINLSANLPAISDNITITGPGTANLVIDGANSYRPFAINSSVSASINALTIRNGYTTTSGGGIYNLGQLTISDMAIEDSRALNGGGGLHTTSSVTINNVTFDGNSASYGGAISVMGGGSITVTGSRFIGNSATGGSGGGIFNGATVSVTETTFTGNSASAGGGGMHTAPGATSTVTKSTFNGNTALYGGALNNGGTLTAGNITVSGNTVTQGGGGIHNGGTANLYNATFWGNGAGGGGAVYSSGATAVVTLTNTILADSASPENCVVQGGGTVTDGGYNLSDDGTCGLSGDNTEPLLNTTLADNGGPTFTHALLANSPALGAGNLLVCAAAPVNGVDQRGNARPDPAGESCDIGAFESPLAASTPSFAVFNFSQATYSAVEGAVNPTVRVNRTGVTTTATSVQITFTNGPAPAATGGTGGSGDYTNTTITVNFTSGQTFVDVPISLNDDDITEPDENFTMTLANPAANGIIGATNPTAVFTILNDDVAGVTVDPTTVNVIEGGATADVEIVLTSQPSSGTVTVSADPDAQCDLGAGAGTAVQHVFTSATWNNPWVITVTAVDDADPEGPHTCTIETAITASGAPEYPISMAVADITANITDDELAPIPGTPALVSPPNGAATSSSTPTFVWGAATDAVEYQFQIDDNADFSSPVQDETLAGTTIVADPLDNFVTYYWRVRGLNVASDPGEWSVVWSITVDPNWLGTPVLNTPRNRTIIGDTTPRFTWRAVPGAVLYTIEVDDNADFSSPERTGASPRPNYVVPDGEALPYGIYFWRVQAVDVGGGLSAWSTPFGFELTLHRLPNNGDFTTNTQPVFRWKGVPGAVSYELELDGATVYNGLALNYKPAAPLTEGQYFWRVRVETSPGVFSEWMPEWVVTVTPPPAPRVTLIAPANRLGTTDTTPELTWEAPATGGPYTYQIQIDNNRNFSSPERDAEVAGTDYTPAALADGKYFWRVRAINNVGVAGNWSQVRAFTVDTTPPDVPILRQPVHRSLITTTTPRFVWQAVRTATEYDLVVSENPDLSAPIIDMPGLRNSAYQTPLANALTPDTTYYWAVKARDKVGNESTWSPVGIFTVSSTLVRPAAPTLLGPANGTLTNDPAPEFTWEALATGGPYTYHIQIDNNRTFGSPEREETDSAGTAYTPALLPDGVYFWRVRAVDANNVAGAWSAIWRVKIDTTPPTVPVLINPANNSGTPNSTPRYTWRGVPGAAAYHIQVATDDGFAPGDIIVEEPSVVGRAFVQPTPLDYGTYYWRAQAIDAAGNLSGWSAANRFDVSILLAPKNGSSSTNTRPVFRWQAVAGAVGYCLQIADNPGFVSPLVDETNLTVTQYRHPTPMPDGTYYWHVAVDEGLGCGPWMETWSTTVTPTPPQRPQLVAPSNNVFLNTNTPTFVWTDVFNAVQYEIQIDDNGNFSSPVQSAIIPAVPPQYLATALADGKYFWRVRAINSVGVPGAWSARRALTVDTIAPAVPTMTGPADGTRVTNRLLRLEWTRVSDAVAYQVQLDTICPPAPGAFPLPPIDVGNRLFYKPPTTLAQNLYCWRVQAFDKAGNASGWSTQWTFTLVAGNTDLNVATMAPAQLPYVETFAVNTTWLAEGGAWQYMPEGAWNGAGWFASSALRGQASALASAAPIDLTAAVNPQLILWQKANLEAGDVFTIEVSLDGGVSWSQVEQQTGLAQDWVQRSVDLSAYRGHLVYLRFVLYTQAAPLSDPAADGVWVDELVIMDAPLTPTVEPATPTPTTEPATLPPSEEPPSEPVKEPEPTPTPDVTPEPTKDPGETPDETMPEVAPEPEEPVPGDPQPEQPAPSEDPTEQAPMPDGADQPVGALGEDQPG